MTRRSRTFWAALALAWVVLLGAGHGLRAETRLALVIGNSAYRHVDALANPANDARAIAAALRSVGFDLVGGGPHLDVTRADMESLIREFGRRLTTDTIAVFYYAGHGLQVNGVNWLVPVEADVAGPSDVKYELVDAGFVLDEMASATDRLNLVFLDACRNNPFASRGLRGIGGGLAEVTAPAGTIIGYATQPGAVAYDGEGGNSPYSTALVQAITQPGTNVLEALNEAGLQVQRATGGRQQPWLALSPIQGQFAFRGIVVPRPEPPGPKTPAPGQEAATHRAAQAASPPRPGDAPGRFLSGEEAGLGAWIRTLEFRVTDLSR